MEERVSYEIAQQEIHAYRVSETSEFPGPGDLKVVIAKTVCLSNVPALYP